MKDARRVVVTGASRGLGLEFVRQLLQGGWQVCALLRNPGAAPGLDSLVQDSGGGLAVMACDVADPGSVRDATGGIVERWNGLELLINNAGIAAGGSRGTQVGLQELDPDEIRRVLDVNLFGPIEVTRSLRPLLRSGSEPAKVVHVTSRMGSIGDNGSGGWWSYRISKAALNMAAVNMAHELRPDGIATMVIHPGWVQTDMGGAGAPLGVEESVAGMLATIEGLELADSGCFRDYTGATVPW